MLKRKTISCAVSVVLVFLSISAAQIQYPLHNFFNSVLNIPTDPSEGLTRDVIKFAPEYDFIIIGAGSGGSVVANRLTEVPAWEVLVLEAGTDEIFLTEIPLTAAMLEFTTYNWGYKAERQNNACIALKNGVCNFPSGRAVGGTSVINYMLYSRGNRNDFDEWARFGNPGWGYQDVLPYFIKSERARNLEDIDEEYHGFDGFLNVEHSPFRTPLVKEFIRSGYEFNYTQADINGKGSLGFSVVQANLRNGRRCSASKAFLRPIRFRPNLHISKETHVTKIIIDPETKQAIGVEFHKRGKIYQVFAKKEVILSAGAFNSPQLLMLSGVGPRKHLQELNLDVIQDSPVGFNLQDHISLPGLAFLVNESVSLTGAKFLNPIAIYNSVALQKGPYTIPGGAEAYAFIRTNISDLPEGIPDIELALASSAINNDATGVIRNLLGLTQEWYDYVYDGIKGKDAFSVVPVLLKPKSTGRVMLRSKNPFHKPLIFPNYFGDDRDLDTLVAGIKMVISFVFICIIRLNL